MKYVYFDNQRLYTSLWTEIECDNLYKYLISTIEFVYDCDQGGHDRYEFVVRDEANNEFYIALEHEYGWNSYEIYNDIYIDDTFKSPSWKYPNKNRDWLVTSKHTFCNWPHINKT